MHRIQRLRVLLHLLLLRLLLDVTVMVHAGSAGMHSLLLHTSIDTIGHRARAMVMRLRAPTLGLGTAIGSSVTEVAAVATFAISRSSN
jgi:hypothetical protein